MQNISDNTGRAQWVIPRLRKSISSKKDTNCSQTSNTKSTQKNVDSRTDSYNSIRSRSSLSITSSDNDSIHNQYTILGNQRSDDQVKRLALVDPHACRTICTIVDEHLRELNQHQALINQARQKSSVNKFNHHEYIHDGTFISMSDLPRLKIRDEQTKASETIKQLTNYLREFSSVKQILESSENLVDDDTLNKLSDTRNSIIQGLNDFILNNSDIDMPILDAENFDYDFCIDAKPRIRDTKTIQENQNWDRKQGMESSFDSYDDIELDSKHDNLEQNSANGDLLAGLERRKKDIQKLEKDTDELRRLFSDFYQLVKVQNDTLDGIEDHIVIATSRISDAHNNISKTRRTLTIMAPVTGCMAGALVGGPLGFAVGGKLAGVSIVCATSLLGLFSSYSARKCITKNEDD